MTYEEKLKLELSNIRKVTKILASMDPDMRQRVYTAAGEVVHPTANAPTPPPHPDHKAGAKAP